jgi:hypothetical protein
MTFSVWIRQRAWFESEPAGADLAKQPVIVADLDLPLGPGQVARLR